MAQRIHNFNPGPAALPASVLEQAKQELLNYDNTGLSILEASHRSDAYERIHERVKVNLKGLKGHRSVGGLRASLDNWVPIESAHALADFMAEFPRQHG